MNGEHEPRPGSISRDELLARYRPRIVLSDTLEQVPEGETVVSPDGTLSAVENALGYIRAIEDEVERKAAAYAVLEALKAEGYLR